MKTKDELPTTTINWIKNLKKETDVTIQTIRCDNSGENKKLMEMVKLDPILTAKFEFTAPYTPEQNGQVERKFATLYGKV